MTRPAHTLLADRGAAVLRESGLRATPQRVAILQLFGLPRGHWTPQEIVTALEEAGPSLAVATVYNTLERFETVGLVRRFTAPDGQTLFDRNTSHHHHALCTDCGEIQDIEMSGDAVRTFLEETTAHLEFEALAANIWIRGVCAQCRSAGGSRLSQN